MFTLTQTSEQSLKQQGKKVEVGKQRGALQILNPRSLATKLRSSGFSTKPATVFHMCVRMVFTQRQVVGVEAQPTSKLSCFEVTYSPQMIQQVLFWRLESSCSMKVRHLWFILVPVSFNFGGSVMGSADSRLSQSSFSRAIWIEG